MLIAAVCFLAYANGANDTFKGVASLFGSRTCGYRAAIGWATVTTLAGSIAAPFLAPGEMEERGRGCPVVGGDVALRGGLGGLGVHGVA